MGFTIDAGWLEAVMLASVRMAAFVVIAPPFSYGAVPGRVKAALAVGLGLAVSPRVAAGYVPAEGGAFFGAIVAELVTGAALGFLVLVIFSAIQSAGSLLDLFGGFQLAMGYDPQSMVQGAQFARLFHLAGIALLVSSGAYLVVFSGVFASFDAIPVGSAIDLAASAEQAIHAVTGMLVAAAQIAAPLIVVLFLADLGLGLLTRVAPALNAFSLGFPLKILLTLALAGTVFVALPAVVEALASDAMAAMREAG
ncbi:flagellar biosynthetic protein FliR [Agromyces sp. G08B096]|uniref:Flagellar biosynthetic protein FliR n=1 Tax=Agromyces sp. G08B096 TaxID=3156399 RepID=A0AAU7W782_9MICO